MRNVEYLLSLMLALLVLSGLTVWTQATQDGTKTAFSCRPGHSAPPVILKGMSLYPRCPGGKRG